MVIEGNEESMFDPESNIAAELKKAVEHHRRNLPAEQKARHARDALEQMVAQLEALQRTRPDHAES